ncbi:hypothetical protein AAZX31_13G294900 [Glycine max]
MASKFIFTTVVLVMLLCLLLMRDPSGLSMFFFLAINYHSDLSDKYWNKSVLPVLKDKKTSALKASLRGSSSNKYGEKPLNWELRKVPSGPDPLHHNGVNPKNPQTP